MSYSGIDGYILASNPAHYLLHSDKEIRDKTRRLLWEPLFYLPNFKTDFCYFLQDKTRLSASVKIGVSINPNKRKKYWQRRAGFPLKTIGVLPFGSRVETSLLNACDDADAIDLDMGYAGFEWVKYKGPAQNLIDDLNKEEQHNEM